MHDLAIIVVSTNEAKWLRPCLSSVRSRSAGIEIDVVVADNQSTDGTADLVESEFPGTRIVTCENRGFSHANNRAVMTCAARYVLFLNPDTEILEGTFAELVRELDARPSVGLAGVRQVTADGNLYPTIRRFPNALRRLGESLGSEHVRVGRRLLGERELDLSQYDREVACDWTSGSFMVVRREALEAAGLLDERFFIYSEETDLCRRIKDAGWEVRHLPTMTILHHASKGGVNPKMHAQGAYARRQYARKHFSPPHRAAYVLATSLGYALRAVVPWRGEAGAQRRRAERRALATALGIAGPPFGEPPPRAVAPRAAAALVIPDREAERNGQRVAETPRTGGIAV